RRRRPPRSDRESERMGADSSPHPNDQTLRAYGLGRLDPATSSEVKRHIAECRECRRRASTKPTAADGRATHEGVGLPTSASGQDLAIASLATFAAVGQVTPTPTPPPPEAALLPQGLANHPDYTNVRKLGSGGMGVVYLAHNTMMGRDEVL